MRARNVMLLSFNGVTEASAPNTAEVRPSGLAWASLKRKWGWTASNDESEKRKDKNTIRKKIWIWLEAMDFEPAASTESRSHYYNAPEVGLEPTTL